MIKVKFCGASGGDVTGSRHIIETQNGKILLDCGIFQGKRNESNEKNRNFLFDPSLLNCVIISHSHIDHIGALPILFKKGFKGDIFLNKMTDEISKIMLLDSARLQIEDAAFYNKIHKDDGDFIEPLYDEDDVRKVFPYFKSVDRFVYFNPLKDVSVKFINAGHVLGSSSIVIGTNGKKILYSGDIGREKQIILKKPDIEENVDFLILETTYGDREHGDINDVEKEISDIINKVYKERGKIIIPSFSLERTQEIIYVIDRLFTYKKIPQIPIYVDSPMSVRITDIFNENKNEYDFSSEFKDYDKFDKDPFGYEYVHYITSVDESKKLNDKEGPFIVISASGMCEGGRVLHHIRNSIDDEKNVLLLVGYQAENTLGRRLKDGAKKVKIFGIPHDVSFEVRSLDFFSSHAGRSDLLNYVIKIKPKKVFLVHGEDPARNSFKDLLNQNGIKEVYLPEMGEEFEL